MGSNLGGPLRYSFGLLFVALAPASLFAQTPSFAYVTSSPNSVAVVNTSTNTVVATVTVGNEPFGVAISPDGTSAYVANSSSGSVSVIDTKSRTVVATVTVGGQPQAVAFSPDGSRAYVTCSADPASFLAVLDTASRAVLATVPLGGDPRGVVVTPDGAAAYVVNSGFGRVQVIDTASNMVANEIPLGSGNPGDAFWIAMAPDGATAYVSNSLSQNVAVVDTPSQSVVATIEVGGSPYGVAIAPDGSRAYVTVAAADGSTFISVIDTAGYAVVDTVFPGSMDNAFGVGMAITPDGSRAYATGTCGGCNSVQAFDTASDAVVASMAPVDRSWGVAIGPCCQDGETRPPLFSKIVVIIFENKDFDEIIGNPDAPYFNQLASQHGLATNYYGVTHPSLGNYLAAIAGDTFGLPYDCEDFSYCNLSGSFPSNLADQVEASGRTWKAYMESMPGSCADTSSYPYAVKHNPFIYFDDIRLSSQRCANIQPYDPASPLADFTWITPDLCNDMHDCSVSTGDAWLQNVTPRILAQPEFQPGGSGVLFVIFDEGERSNQVVALVVGPLVKPGYQSTVFQDHYSLLRTIEQSWGLPLLGHAGDPETTNMADFFQRPQ